jgi:type I restriction enzyme S subunit
LLLDPKACDSKFTALQLKLCVQIFKHISRGTTIAGVTKKQLLDVPFDLPRLPVQRRIVAEIEKQFTRLEAGVAALRRVQANLKRYRAAVLKAACEGRLVPTEAEFAKTGNRKAKFESGEALLTRILTERRKSWQGRGKYKEPAVPEPMADVELPEGWVWTGFEQLADGTKNAIKAGPFGSSLKKSFYTPSGFKIYGQEQVIKGDPYFGDYFISRELFEQLQSCEVKLGDILISLVGTTGKVLILPDDCAPGIINPRLLKLSLNRSGVNPKFIKILLESATTRAFFKLAAHGGTMEILNLGILKTLPIALPPLAEQTRIVAEVERRLSVVEELESVVTANLQRATRLRQSILSRAFSGNI